MAKLEFAVAVGFGKQLNDTDYNPTLAGITTDWGGDPDGVAGGRVDEGLLLGSATAGIGESGLDLTLGRESTDKPPLESSFTRPISDFLRLGARTFSFAFPMVGPRRTTTGTPQDSDFAPGVGVDAIFDAFGLVATPLGGPVGYSIKPAATSQPCSALIFDGRSRVELLSCRGESLAIEYTPGSIPVATATFSVGGVNFPTPSDKPLSEVTIPNLFYGQQSAVSAAPVESVGNVWGGIRGYSELTVTLENTISEVGDSNAPSGVVRERDARVINYEGVIYPDDSIPVYEIEQLLAETSPELDSYSFTVGTPATGDDAAIAHTLIAPQLELDEAGPDKLGSKLVVPFSGIARADNANQEWEIRYL